jgi:hypothetical protein
MSGEAGLTVTRAGLARRERDADQPLGLEPDKTRSGGVGYVIEQIRQKWLFASDTCQLHSVICQQNQGFRVWQGAKP